MARTARHVLPGCVLEQRAEPLDAFSAWDALALCCRGEVKMRRAAPCCAGTLGAFEAAEVALRILHALVQGRVAADASGRPLLPLPRVRRQLASPACLPHLAQARPRLRSFLNPKIADSYWF